MNDSSTTLHQSTISLHEQGDPIPVSDPMFIVSRGTIGSARRSHQPDDSRIHYQVCGGGRRIIRKSIRGE
jgi:hypothetical protein